jgi:hypothetical protein
VLLQPCLATLSIGFAPDGNLVLPQSSTSPHTNLHVQPPLPPLFWTSHLTNELHVQREQPVEEDTELTADVLKDPVQRYKHVRDATSTQRLLLASCRGRQSEQLTTAN